MTTGHQDAEHVAWSPTALVECIQVIIHESGGKIIPGIVFERRGRRHHRTSLGNCGGDEGSDSCLSLLVRLRGVTGKTPENETVFSLANKHVATIPQIESRLGINNLEAVMQLDEIFAFMIGGDFSQHDAHESAFAGWVGGRAWICRGLREGHQSIQRAQHPLLGIAVGDEMVKGSEFSLSAWICTRLGLG
ncbi:hypothetical protein C8F04DRAFT_1195872 [Mycena alexandri]|uniref:Uncharacterized protein n=1 Tax=Mycena alexandri TaxID=1745969 RepID=A0AAD6WRL7_9AGAR|nr:hypothetical protein C8F04DRAFT_1195872 [Mycena alexandri]